MSREDGYKNLTPVRSKDEARKRGQKGGVESGKSRRKIKQMNGMLKYILDLDVKEPDLREKMSEMGFAEEQITYNAIMCYAMVNKAAHGDVKAAEFIRDTTGQKPQENVKVEGELSSKFTVPANISKMSLDELREIAGVTVPPVLEPTDDDGETDDK